MAIFDTKPTDALGDNPMRKIGQFRLLVNMLRDHLNKSYTGMASWVIPSIVLALIYVIMPFDFDFIPVVGWIDDAAVLGILYKFLSKEIRKYEAWKNKEEFQ